MSGRVKSVLRYGEIAESLEIILVKFNGQSDPDFIVHALLMLALYEPAAVTVALLELLHGPKPDGSQGLYPDCEVIREQVRRVLVLSFVEVESAGGWS